jgi:UDP-N-acetyl-D-mannosaminuronic acid dehydrogenase
VIIAVGTPLNEQGVASMVALEQVCQSVGSRLRRGDIVILRSTVPVGTTRTLVIPLLESISGLKAGKGFHVAFCPERTVEGKAIQELSSLPQIVGGATDMCVDKASAFWAAVTDTIVRADSLEASELVKLINNSYRDLSFAFANGLALLADNYNIDTARLIAAANEGYPRNPIPVPSPGVGGYCLTKDPFLYASVNSELGHAELSRLGRKVNEEAGRYPVTVLETFAYGMKRKVESLRVLLIGMAFKGNPETNDLRGSVSVSIARELIQRGCNVQCFDAVIGEQELRNHGLNPARMNEALSNSDAVLVLNNHEKNIPINFLQSIGSGGAVLVFDGWSLLERHEAEKYPGVIYANLGYMTKTDRDVTPPYPTKF